MLRLKDTAPGEAEEVGVCAAAELVVEAEAEDGGDDHLGEQDHHHEDQVLVQTPLQSRELVLRDLGVERDLGLGPCKLNHQNIIVSSLHSFHLHRHSRRTHVLCS